MRGSCIVRQRRWSSRRRAPLQRLMRQLEPSFPHDDIPTAIVHGHFTRLNLFEGGGDYQIEGVSGIAHLAHLEVLNLGKICLHGELALAGCVRLRHLRLSNYCNDGVFEVSIVQNRQLEEVSGDIYRLRRSDIARASRTRGDLRTHLFGHAASG